MNNDDVDVVENVESTTNRLGSRRSSEHRYVRSLTVTRVSLGDDHDHSGGHRTGHLDGPRTDATAIQIEELLHLTETDTPSGRHHDGGDTHD